LFYNAWTWKHNLHSWRLCLILFGGHSIETNLIIVQTEKKDLFAIKLKIELTFWSGLSKNVW
jgi:hypothetical protein